MNEPTIESPTPIAEGLAAITVRPGDKLILRCSAILTSEQVQRIKHSAEQWDPSIPVLVVSGGMDVLVCRKAD